MNRVQSFITQAASAGDRSWADLRAEQKQFLIDSPPAPVYTYETRSKATRIALRILKDVLSVLFLPYGFYRLVHYLGGKLIVPAQLNRNHKKLRRAFAEALEGKSQTLPLKDLLGKPFYAHVFCGIAKENDLAAKRVSVLVNGEKIDAVMLGRKKNLDNKRWTLFSNGNGMTWEENLALNSNSILKKIDELDTNFLLYNYQGVGASQGGATRNGIVNAHKAMLHFLDDEKSGIGAKEIIQWGTSIGGGVQGHAMDTYQLKEGINYISVKDQTFSKISKVPSKFLGFLIRVFGWEISSVNSSKMLEENKKVEIIIQTAKKSDKLSFRHLLHDGVIPANGSLAHRLMSTMDCFKHKLLVAVNAQHCHPFSEREEAKIFQAIRLALRSMRFRFESSPA